MSGIVLPICPLLETLGFATPVGHSLLDVAETVLSRFPLSIDNIGDMLIPSETKGDTHTGDRRLLQSLDIAHCFFAEEEFLDYLGIIPGRQAGLSVEIDEYHLRVDRK